MEKIAVKKMKLSDYDIMDVVGTGIMNNINYIN